MLRHLLEFIRYGITGLLSMLAYLVVGNLLHYASCGVWTSTAIAWIASVLVAYFGHIHFSYRVKAEHKRMSFRFAVMLAFHLAQTAGITYILADVLKLSYPVTTVLTVMITPLTTYPIGKYWVFKES